MSASFSSSSKIIDIEDFEVEEIQVKKKYKPKIKLNALKCVVCSHVCIVFLPRCPRCGEVNSLSTPCSSSEIANNVVSETDQQSVQSENQFASEDSDDDEEEEEMIVPLGKIDPTDPPRISSGEPGFDHVLGGGLVLGSVVVIYGAPGAGKSTLSTEVATGCAQQFPVFYAVGEESKERVRRRTQRMQLLRRFPKAKDNLLIVDQASKDTGLLCALLLDERPKVCIVDSLMSIASEDILSAPGSPAQVKAAARAFTEVAQETKMAILCIAHVTNDGKLAGPSGSKHDVDTLLMLEHVKPMPDGTFKVVPRRIPKISLLRLAAFTKNRDGDVAATAYYKMSKHGLTLVAIEDEDGLTDVKQLNAKKEKEDSNEKKRSSKSLGHDREKTKRDSAKSSHRTHGARGVERPVLSGHKTKSRIRIGKTTIRPGNKPSDEARTSRA
jgi:predicted ATP-dependent serine protease